MQDVLFVYVQMIWEFLNVALAEMALYNTGTNW